MTKKKDDKKEEATKAVTQTAEQATKEPKGENKYYGTVIWYNPKGKGFGFIVMDGKKEKDDDIFMHRSQVMEGKDGKEPNIDKGDRVSFFVVDPPEGNQRQKPMASEIVLIEKAPKEEKAKDEEKDKKAEEVKTRYENKQKTGDTSG